jgi:hypothetical protein
MKYKLAILGLVFILVFILLLTFRGTIRRWTAELNSEIQQKEGMTPQRKLLRFSPNKTDNAGVEFYADELRRETLAMLQFFKERKHLVDDAVGGPSAAEKMVAAIPPRRVQPPPVPVVDPDKLAAILKPPEQMTTMKESMATAGYDEYGSTVMEEQDIYRTYNALKTRETELMDEMFGEYFVAKNWSKPDNGLSKTMAIKLEYYDSVYSKVKYHVLQTKEEFVFLPRVFAKYFVILTTKNKNSDTKLKQIKQTLYNILRPTFIMQQFFAEYSTNSGKYPAKTDALFFINKCMESLNTENNPNMPTSLDDKGKDAVTLKIGPTGSVHTFKDDDSDYTNRDILADGVSVTDSVLVASYIYRLAEINAPHFVMTTETFLRNYAVFLEKNRERKYPGAYEFLVKNIDNIKMKTT